VTALYTTAQRNSRQMDERGMQKENPLKNSKNQEQKSPSFSGFPG